MITVRTGTIAALLLSVAAFSAACSNTWEGAKKDTGKNLEATGEAIDDAGEAVQE